MSDHLTVAEAKTVLDGACRAEQEATHAYRAAEAELRKPVTAAVQVRQFAEQALANALAAEQGIKVGDVREWRGRRYSVSRWSYYLSNEVKVFGRLIRKDGTLGVNEQELWGW